MSYDSLCWYGVRMLLAFLKCVLITVLGSVLLTVLGSVLLTVLGSVLLTCLDGLIIQLMLYCLLCRMSIIMYTATMNVKAHSCFLFSFLVYLILFIGKLPKNGIQIIFKVMKRK